MTNPQIIKVLIVLTLGILTTFVWWRYRSKRRQFLLLAASLGIAFGIAEWGLRNYKPQYDGHNDLFEPDNVLGWRFKSNHRGSIAYSGEANHYVQLNERGYRDQPFDRAKPNDKTILCFGDSFVSNLTVPDDRVFTRIVEQRLEQTTILNLGVNGYGQTQELLQMNAALDSMSADLIMVMIYLRNDFTDNLSTNWIYSRPVIHWDENDSPMIQFLLPEELEAPSHMAALGRSHVVSLANHAINNVIYRFGIDQIGPRPTAHTPPELYLCSNSEWEGTDRLFRTMEHLLGRMNQTAEKRQIPILFVIAPSKYQVDETLWRTLLTEYDEDPAEYRASLPNEKLLRFAKENRLPMLDLLPPFREASAKGEEMYHRKDPHWNQRGNELAATTLSKYLSAAGWPGTFDDRPKN